MLIPAAAIEFVDGGNTIWIHASDGSTALRIKATGKVYADRCATSPTTHGDMIVEGDIRVCLGKDYP